MMPSGVIRKIVLGTNPIDGLSFVVGKEIGKTGKVISTILEDTNNYYLFGVIRYWVYYKEGEKEYVWKSFVNIPVLIEYDENHKEESLI